MNISLSSNLYNPHEFKIKIKMRNESKYKVYGKFTDITYQVINGYTFIEFTNDFVVNTLRIDQEFIEDLNIDFNPHL